MNKLPNKNLLKEIVEKRLLQVPVEIKKFFPTIIAKSEVDWYVVSTNTYFFLAFIDLEEKRRIEKLIANGYHPFPGLIAENTSAPVAFNLEKSRNIYIKGSSVKNMFTLSLGNDSTVILCDHYRSINTLELGDYEYHTNLAYIISFGNEITHDNEDKKGT